MPPKQRPAYQARNPNPPKRPMKSQPNFQANNMRKPALSPAFERRGVGPGPGPKPYPMESATARPTGQMPALRGKGRYWTQDPCHLPERPKTQAYSQATNREVAYAGQYAPSQNLSKNPGYANSQGFKQQGYQRAQPQPPGFRNAMKLSSWKEVLENLSEIKDIIDLATMKTAWDVLDDEDKAAAQWLADNANRYSIRRMLIDWKAFAADMKEREDAKKEGAEGIAKYNYKKGTVNWQKNWLLGRYKDNWPSYRELHPQYKVYHPPNVGAAGRGRGGNLVGANMASKVPAGPYQNALLYRPPAYQDYPARPTNQTGPGLTPPYGVGTYAQAAYLPAGRGRGRGQYAGVLPGSNF